VKRTSQTSVGSTQVWPRPIGVLRPNGEAARRNGCKRRQMASSVASSKPVPTRPTYVSVPPS
jgi:hypothetical protein